MKRCFDNFGNVLVYKIFEISFCCSMTLKVTSSQSSHQQNDFTFISNKKVSIVTGNYPIRNVWRQMMEEKFE